MMRRIAVGFDNETLELEVDEDLLLENWDGPPGLDGPAAEAALRASLAEPIDYPPLRRMVVPGDRIVIPCDLPAPMALAILPEVVSQLRAAEVESITVVTTEDVTHPIEGVEWLRHDRSNREGLAYLASTASEQRVYLNRVVTDADSVIAIGQLGFDPSGRPLGPWSLIYPGISDEEGLRRELTRHSREADDDQEEAAEVSWLLGNPFQIAVLPGRDGIRAVYAGAGESVRLAASAALRSDWSFRVTESAGLVVAGLGGPDRETRWDDLAKGLASARRVVSRGGRIVLLSRLQGDVGPALSRVLNAGDRRSAASAIRGKETEPDWLVAHELVETLAWADVFLHSRLDPELVDKLGICPVDSPSNARRLAKESTGLIALSQADRTDANLSNADETEADHVDQ